MNEERYVVDYDHPQVPAAGEEVGSVEEAERIAAERKKEGYVNVRITPVEDEDDG